MASRKIEWWFTLLYLLIVIPTRNLLSDEPRFEDEIYLPEFKFAFKAHVQDMSRTGPNRYDSYKDENQQYFNRNTMTMTDFVITPLNCVSICLHNWFNLLHEDDCIKTTHYLPLKNTIFINRKISYFCSQALIERNRGRFLFENWSNISEDMGWCVWNYCW